jgi:hypothetical protein
LLRGVVSKARLLKSILKSICADGNPTQNFSKKSPQTCRYKIGDMFSRIFWLNFEYLARLHRKTKRHSKSESLDFLYNCSSIKNIISSHGRKKIQSMVVLDIILL